jgi:hypothetical protein
MRGLVSDRQETVDFSLRQFLHLAEKLRLGDLRRPAEIDAEEESRVAPSLFLGLSFFLGSSGMVRFINSSKRGTVKAVSPCWGL